MLQAHNINKVVDTLDGDLHILKNVSLQVEAGQSLAIIGASGSGKSTLLAILAGLDVASSGAVVLAGQDLSTLDEEGRAQVRADQVGFVFQSFQLLPGLTALENVMLPLELHADTRKQTQNAKKQAQEFLTRVGLAERLNHYPKQLSGGEQQRVAIARAFACKPNVLFADEPTGNLDSITGAKIIELLFDLNKEQGTTLIMVTHEARLAQRCQQQLHLEAGAVVSDADESTVSREAAPC